MFGLARRIVARRTRNRFTSILLLLFQAFFLNVVIPGHTRGVITLSGKVASSQAADFGCPMCATPAKQQKNPTRNDQRECAICQLALHLSPATVFVPHIADLGLLETLPPLAPTLAVKIEVTSLDRCRDPPTLSV